MLAIRLYVCVLTLGFLVLATMNRGIGILEGVVVTCAIVYLILDARADLKDRQAELGKAAIGRRRDRRNRTHPRSGVYRHPQPQ